MRLACYTRLSHITRASLKVSPQLRPAHSWTHKSSIAMAAAASNTSPNAFMDPINKTAHAFDKTTFDALLARRFFFIPSFEIYGGK